MSLFAYIDKQGRSSKNANNLTEADKDKYTFYCPNEKCRVRMSLSIYQNANNRFRASFKNESHVDNCWADSKMANTLIYPPKNCDLDDIIDNLSTTVSKEENINKSKISETKSKNDEDVVHRKMSTLRDIFLYCKSHNINEYLYDQQIKYVFLDHRTEHIYSKYMEEGNKLICYQMHYYIPEKKFVIRYNKLILNVYFENNTTYNNVQDKLDLDGENLSDVTILFAGKWIKEDNSTYYTVIKNPKQVLRIS